MMLSDVVVSVLLFEEIFTRYNMLNLRRFGTDASGFKLMCFCCSERTECKKPPSDSTNQVQPVSPQGRSTNNDGKK